MLTISWFASCYASFADNIIGDSFVKSCPDDGVPVCGLKGNNLFLFPNQCLLNEANKDVFIDKISMSLFMVAMDADNLRSDFLDFKKLPLYRCIHGCRLACPKDYKPICAINLHTREKKLFVSLCELTKYACKTNLGKFHVYQLVFISSIK